MKRQHFLSVASLAALASILLLFPGSAAARGGGGGHGHGHAGFHSARGASFGHRGFRSSFGFGNFGGFGYWNDYWPGYYSWGWYPYWEYSYPLYYYYAIAAHFYNSAPPTTPSYAAAWNKPAAGSDTVVDIRMPTADAKLWVDGKATEMTGVARKITTNALSAGTAQLIEFRVEWTEGDRKFDRTRVIEVRAGRQYYTNLAVADKEKVPAPKTE